MSRWQTAYREAYESERNTRQTDVNRQFYFLLSPMLRFPIFRHFSRHLPSMWNYRYYPLYLFHLFTSRTFLLRLILTSLQITYDWYVWSARSEISFDYPSFTIFWDAIKILGLWRLRDAEEERKEGCKRPIRYPIRGWEECPPLPWQLGKHPTDV